jgi:chemotaxis protein methyltransferase CheR
VTLALRGIADLLERESGIRLEEHRYGALTAALRRAAPGVTPEQFLRLARDPVRGAPEMARLLDEVTVQESSFFRESEALDGVDWSELLARAAASGSAVVRVWVAGCANGEEAYTLAILACEAFGHASPPVSILATDVSWHALERAREGAYRERGLRELSNGRRARWLRPAPDGRLAVGDELRRLVHFRRHNLVAEPVPPAGEARFQLVACRNVLIYFNPAKALEVSRRLATALAPGGVLLLGAADAVSAAAAGQDLPEEVPSTPPTPAGRPRPAVAGRDELLTRARAAAEAGRAGEALAHVDTLLRRDPLDAGAHSLRGLVELAGGDAEAAAASLRRALFAEPDLGPAAFMLGCAHEAAGRDAEARAAYVQALRTLGGNLDERYAAVFGELDLAKALAGCRARLEGSAR